MSVAFHRTEIRGEVCIRSLPSIEENPDILRALAEEADEQWHSPDRDQRWDV